jgi:hypothetical protein
MVPLPTDLHSEGKTPAVGKSGKETQVQAEVLRILSGGDNSIVMKLIDRVSSEVRTIITEFEKQNGRIPEADEIIWITGEHHKLDPRYVDRLLENTADIRAIQEVKNAIQQQQATNIPLAAEASGNSQAVN